MVPPYAVILRAGAHDVDEHFRTADFEDNIPVMLGLTGVWNTTFLGYPSLAILPYTQALSKLAPHIQQVKTLSSLTHPLSSHVHLDDCPGILCDSTFYSRSLWTQFLFPSLFPPVCPFDLFSRGCQLLRIILLLQVSMESNGKGVSLDGSKLTFEAGEIDFGEPGTNGQHSFYQLIHQGRVVPCEFIGIVKSQQSVYLKVSPLTPELMFTGSNLVA